MREVIIRREEINSTLRKYKKYQPKRNMEAGMLEIYYQIFESVKYEPSSAAIKKVVSL